MSAGKQVIPKLGTIPLLHEIFAEQVLIGTTVPKTPSSPELTAYCQHQSSVKYL